MSESKKYATLLIIAASDSIGGAGIQADIKTATARCVYAMTALTAATAQNTRAVEAIWPLPPEAVKGQIEAVLADVVPDAVKLGMLHNAGIVRVVAREIRTHGLKHVVCDPVAVASCGDSLSADSQDMAGAMRSDLFPLCELVTPNIPEAEVFLGRKVEDPEADAQALLKQWGCGAVLLKGGHGQSAQCTDILATGESCMKFVHPRISTRNSHGTGCTLSSAIACGLAKGLKLEEAVEEGIEFVTEALRCGAPYALGGGTGPLCFWPDKEI